VPQGARTAFLSSPFRSGGGLAGADAVCAADAAAAHLPGSFKALLGDVRKPPFDPARFDTSRGPWYRVDGVQVVQQASDYARPHGPRLLAPISVTASGEYVATGGLAWLGFGGNDGDLTLPGVDLWTCNGWTTSVGNARMTTWSSVLMYWGPVTCEGEWPVECLQQ
jgi:hypothetical protein